MPNKAMFSGRDQNLAPIREHPIQKIKFQQLKARVDFKDKVTSVAQGECMKTLYERERCCLAEFRRLPGLPSSRLGLRSALGLNDRVEFEDVLNEPCESP